MNTDNRQASIERTALDEPGEETAINDPGAARESAWRDWMMVGLGLTGLLSVLAVVVSISALGSNHPNTTMIAGQSASGMMAGQSGSGTQGSAAAGKPEAVKLAVKSDSEHGKRGSDGQWHDAFLPGDFTVHAGDTVTVSVSNYDNMPHSFTSSSLSGAQLINQMIPAGSANSPSQTTFTFTAPSKPGKYAWWCAMPCDPWAMAHDGFMRGYVTVTA